MSKKYKNTDLTIEDLPKNRKEVFFDVCKNRYRMLIFCGIILLISAIPFLALYMTMLSEIGKIQQNLASAVVTQETYNQQYFQINLIIPLFMLASSVIIIIALSGVTRIIHRLAWGEGVAFFYDFFLGIKQNFLSFLMLIFIGISFYVSNLIKTVILLNGLIETYSVFYYYIPLFINIFLFFPIVLLYLMQSVIYKNTFIGKLKNAILLFIKKFLINVCYMALLSSFLIFIVFATAPYKLIVVSIFIFTFPLWILAYVLIASSIFDEYINIYNYKEIYKKGIYFKE
ncbi:MAG: hypothetical protein GX931_03565 [Acholeplasmataceae bacterium]|jgi:hypothetical protein|nr:hypothetical protein [Acholeplasmataceae bacterium]